MELHEDGTLERCGVELIGADEKAIHRAEDRDVPPGHGASRPAHAAQRDGHQRRRGERAWQELGLPLVVRPAYTLGGGGGGIARDAEEFERSSSTGWRLSPISQVLLEESVVGWHEFELEVMRDRPTTS